MASSTPEYEVVWNGTMEVEARRLAREALVAQPRLRQTHEDAHARVYDFVALHPGAIMRDIQTGTALSREAVNNSLWILEKRGALSRSHYQRDDRSQPVRWITVA